jgi:hypothetical protein
MLAQEAPDNQPQQTFLQPDQVVVVVEQQKVAEMEVQVAQVVFQQVVAAEVEQLRTEQPAVQVGREQTGLQSSQPISNHEVRNR